MDLEKLGKPTAPVITSRFVDLAKSNAYKRGMPHLRVNFIYYGRQRGQCGDAEASPARIFPALDFLAALCTHIPDPGQQLVRYSGAILQRPSAWREKVRSSRTLFVSMPSSAPKNR